MDVSRGIPIVDEGMAQALDPTFIGPAPVDDALTKTRLDFAQRCFSNVQELSRFMDQKAGYLLSAVSLLTLALGIVAARALDIPNDSDLHIIVHTAGLVFFTAYVIVAFLVVYLATRVFHALPNMLRPVTAAPGLMFPLILLSRIKDQSSASANEELYYQKLSQVTIDGMIRDYANQITEVSFIYRHKQQYVNRATRLFAVLVVCWVMTMLLLTATMLLQSGA